MISIRFDLDFISVYSMFFFHVFNALAKIIPNNKS